MSRSNPSVPPEFGQVTLDHFRDEDAYRARTGYAALVPHVLSQKDRLAAFCAYSNDTWRKDGGLPEKFLMSIKPWLTANTREIDMTYGPKSAREPDALLRPG